MPTGLALPRLQQVSVSLQQGREEGRSYIIVYVSEAHFHSGANHVFFYYMYLCSELRLFATWFSL